MHADRISVPWLICPAASRKKENVKKAESLNLIIKNKHLNLECFKILKTP